MNAEQVKRAAQLMREMERCWETLNASRKCLPHASYVICRRTDEDAGLDPACDIPRDKLENIITNMIADIERELQALGVEL